MHIRKPSSPNPQIQECSVRRRYSEFVWLREEIKAAVKINVAKLPERALLRQVPFLAADDGIFEEEFIEERRQGLRHF